MVNEDNLDMKEEETVTILCKVNKEKFFKFQSKIPQTLKQSEVIAEYLEDFDEKRLMRIIENKLRLSRINL